MSAGSDAGALGPTTWKPFKYAFFRNTFPTKEDGTSVVGSPRWSDLRALASRSMPVWKALPPFTSIPSAAASPHCLNSSTEEYMVTWSRDGRWIYFSSISPQLFASGIARASMRSNSPTAASSSKLP